MLLKGITFKHHGDFHCLNCVDCFATEKECGFHKRVCKNKVFCSVVMSSRYTKMLEFNQYQRSDNAPFLFIKSLNMEKSYRHKDNPENYL